ncbi:MAG: DUF2497 domain-containing protein [Sphingomonadaceae bacterium]|nr:DUF2497 domain-containing protein [Sphingomonadaceae bacterium]
MAQQGEASVEEILESIKKVIARDNRAGAAVERRRRENDGVRDTASPGYDTASDDILDLGDADLVREDKPDPDALISEGARASMRDNLAALAMLAEPGAQPQIVRSGETSLEGMVRDMLRPMLAEWLDQNLPGMVEKMVRDEIARIAGKRG